MSEYKVGKPFRMYDQTVVFVKSVTTDKKWPSQERVVVEYHNGGLWDMPRSQANQILKPAVFFDLENYFAAYKE